MPISEADIKAVICDFGDTLVDARHLFEQEAIHLQRTLSESFGFCDGERLREIRSQQLGAPQQNDYRENDLRLVHSDLVQQLYNKVATEEQIQTLLSTQHETLVRATEMTPDVKSVLKNLCTSYELGLISNYPDGETIRESLRRLGVFDLFEAVVVSGDVGRVKPHPKPFEAMLGQLELLPAQCIYIGDSPVADVQGAKAVGMWSVLTTQYRSQEVTESVQSGCQPDGRIQHLQELEVLLASEH